MRKLLKYLLSVICISFVGGMITLFIGNHYDSLQRTEYEKERAEWLRLEDENKKIRYKRVAEDYRLMRYKLYD